MRLIGYSNEEVMGHSLVQEFITNDYQASVQSVLDQALAGDETENFEFPLITKAGAHIEVLLNATTRRDEQGNVIGVVGIGQDITARLAQEKEYSKLIDTANAPIFGVDTEGRVNVWNKNAHKLVGYAPEEVMGKNLVREFITDEFKTAVQAVLDQALHGEETANFEFPLMTKGGVVLDVLLNATTRRDEQGNIIGVVGIGQDVSNSFTVNIASVSWISLTHFEQFHSTFFLFSYRLRVAWPKSVNIQGLSIRQMLPSLG